MVPSGTVRAVGDGLRAVAHRSLNLALTMVGASLVTFALIPLSPGSPAVSILTNDGRRLTDAAIAAKEHELGLDRPLVAQYLSWIGRLLRGDLGRSWKTQYPVSTLIRERIGATLMLGATALVIGLVVSVGVALVATRFHDRFGDHALRIVTLVVTGVPTFVLGLLVLQYIVVGWGIGKVVADGSLGSVWLPALVLSAAGIAGWSRPLRALLLDAKGSSYSRTMIARGATPRRVLLVHALPNAFVPFLGILGLGLGGIIGGAPIVESVFSWPGLGAQVVQSVQQRDVPVIQAFVLLSTLGYVLGSLLADLTANALDPRRRTTSRDGRP